MDITTSGQGPGNPEANIMSPPAVPAPEGVTPSGLNLPPAEEPLTAPDETSIPTGVDQPRVGEVPAPMPDEEGSAPLPGGPLTQEENPSTAAGLAPDSGVPEGPVLTDTPPTEMPSTGDTQSPAVPAPEGVTSSGTDQPSVEAPVIEPDKTSGVTLSQEDIDQQKIDPAKHETSESLEGVVGGPLTSLATRVPIIESTQAPAEGPGATETPVDLPEQAQEQVPPAPATEQVKDTAPVSPGLESEVQPLSKLEKKTQELIKKVEELVEGMREFDGNMESIKGDISRIMGELEDLRSDSKNPEAKGGESS